MWKVIPKGIYMNDKLKNKLVSEGIIGSLDDKKGLIKWAKKNIEKIIIMYFLFFVNLTIQTQPTNKLE